MKPIPVASFSLGLVMIALTVLPSCTGDPAYGGIGWSPRKAGQEREVIENEIDRTNADTNRLQRQGDRLNRQIDLRKQEF